MAKKHIITIAGRPGSGKSSAAKELAQRLGYQHFSSGDLFRQLGQERGIDVLRANRSAKESAELDHLVDERLRLIGSTEDRKVIDSRTAWHWIPTSFKIFLDLDLQEAARRILQDMDDSRLNSEDISQDPAKYAVQLQHRLDSENQRYKAKYNIDPYDMGNYDLVIDTAKNGLEQVVAQALEAFNAWTES